MAACSCWYSYDAIYCVEEGEYERDDWDELDEVQVGEESEDVVIVDVEQIKDDYWVFLIERFDDFPAVKSVIDVTDFRGSVSEYATKKLNLKFSVDKSFITLLFCSCSYLNR